MNALLASRRSGTCAFAKARSPARPRTPVVKLTTCALTSVALLLTGCKTIPSANDNSLSSTVSTYASSCLMGAVGGAVLDAVLDKATGKKSAPADKRKELAKAAAAGCAVGLAVTAIGKLMDQRQQAKHEEEMQKEARRRALEQQQYAAATQKAQSQSANTPQQRAARDAELERARVAYQASINQPVRVDLGNGGVSTIQVQPQAPVTAGGQAPAQAGCTDFSVLVNTSAGQARQFETWCPNNAGQMVRADVRATAT